MNIEELKNKRILILGFGKEGKDTYLALRKLFPKKKIGIADEKFGKDYLKRVGDYDVIIKTPGIPLTKVKPLLRKGAEITSQTEIFFDNFKGLIIGVTGTKGKGTVSSLIYQILKKEGLKAHLGGNIGQPVFQRGLKSRGKEIFVMELSSHQLQNLKKSPQIAVFLNLYPDHLDYYKNLREYQKAKESICYWQKPKDWLVYNADDKIVCQIAKKSKAQKIPVRASKKRYESPLKGNFNVFNIVAAVEVAKILEIPEKTIREAVKKFKPLAHRLEFVGKYRGIEFYNDSMSTIPEATIAALEALPETTTLLVGGSDKGSNYSKMAEVISKSKVKNLIVLGKGTGEKILKELKEGAKLLPSRKEFRSFLANSMQEAVKIAYQKTPKQGICLLSPGAASFNLFENYKARGNLFKKWIKHYGSRHAKK